MRSLAHAAPEHVEIALEPERDAGLRRFCARVSAVMKAPPPVAITRGPSAKSRAITRRSPSRK